MSKIKYLIISCLQLLVVSLLLIVTVLERWLTNALERLAAYLLSPRTFKMLKRIVESRPAVDTQEGFNTDETDKAIKEILFVLDKQSNWHLNNDRKTFEDTVAGREIVAQHTDRHLYAVLRPSRLENMERIENVLRAMAPYDLTRVHWSASKSMRLYV